MITRHHILLGLLCSLIPGAVIAGSDPVLAFVCIGGILIGIILPDIHMKRPKKTSLLTVAWIVVQAGRNLCVPLLCRTYRRVFRTDFLTDDKRLTHSVIGVYWYSVVLGGIVMGLAFLSGDPRVVLPAAGFTAGLVSGLFLHLVQDACTKKGIFPLYPFTDTRLTGSIRPCDIMDRRITGFHVYHGTVLFFFLLIQSAATLSVYEIAGFSIFSLGLCNVTMVWQSETRIESPPQETFSGEAVTT
jgi:membrane-bound metal-dependent hydrolase YbcI (DUF457 family)